MTTNPDIETDIPNAIYVFFRDLSRAVDNRDTAALYELYESRFDALTQEYYIVGIGQFRSWPSPKLPQVASELRNRTAELLYTFLYNKHLFTGRSVRHADATAAWATFNELFDMLPRGACELPNGMLWDVFDEFVFQMTVVYQRRYVSAREWAVPLAFRLLDRVIAESNVREVLRPSEPGEERKRVQSTRTLSGYFATVAKAKLNVLLGDYYGALSKLEALDIYGAGRGVLQSVVPAHISLFYHVGFSYLMLHRYEDASNCFRRCLSVKAKGRRFSERVQLDAAYMFVCARVLGGMVVSNISYYLDSNKLPAFEDDKETLRSGDEDRFREVFERCSPKFLAVPPATASAATAHANTMTVGAAVRGSEGRELQARMFRRAVQQQQQIIKLRGYFGVYQNTKMSLLETLLETDDGYAPLFALKMRSRQLVHDGESANLLSGQYRVSSQYDCIVSDDSVEVVSCATFGGTETKLYNKIKGLQRDQRLTLRQNVPRQQLQRRDYGAAAQGLSNNAVRRQMYGRGGGGGMGGGRGGGGIGGGSGMGGGRGGGAARQYGTRMTAAVVQPGNSLFNRNEN